MGPVEVLHAIALICTIISGLFLLLYWGRVMSDAQPVASLWTEILGPLGLLAPGAVRQPGASDLGRMAIWAAIAAVSGVTTVVTGL